MNRSDTHQIETKQTPYSKRIVIGLTAAVMMAAGGGYALGTTNVFTAPTVAANSDSSSRHGNMSSKDVAYITDAVERYFATAGFDPDMQQVARVTVSGSYAIGGLENGDSGAVFFAQKINNVWTVLYHGQDITPDAQAALLAAGFPPEWINSPNLPDTNNE